MKTYSLTKSQLIRKPLSEVFSFFERPENLERITPHTLGFKIQTPIPIEMKKGAIIDYRIKINGIALKWKTLISEYEPGHRFVDEQLRGPYALWRHEHIFQSVNDGTLITDNLTYALPLGFIGEIAHALFVERKILEIFRFREEIMESIFE